MALQIYKLFPNYSILNQKSAIKNAIEQGFLKKMLSISFCFRTFVPKTMYKDFYLHT